MRPRRSRTSISAGQIRPQHLFARFVTTREFTEELRLAFNPAGWALSGVAGGYFNNANRHYYVNYLTPGYAQFRQFLHHERAAGRSAAERSQLLAARRLLAQAIGGVHRTQLRDHRADGRRPRALAGTTWSTRPCATRMAGATAAPRCRPARPRTPASTRRPNCPIRRPTTALLRQRLQGRAAGRRQHQQPRGERLRPGLRPLSARQPVELRDRRQDPLVGRRAHGERRGVLHQVERRAAGRNAALLLSDHRRTPGAAVVHGGELEIRGPVGRPLQLGGGVGYTKAVLGADAPNLGGTKGEQLENVPLWNGNAHAKVSVHAGGRLRRVRCGRTASMSESPIRTSTAAIPPPSSAPTRCSIFAPACCTRRWEADIFMTNVLDKQAALSQFICRTITPHRRARACTPTSRARRACPCGGGSERDPAFAFHLKHHVCGRKHACLASGVACTTST